MPETSQEVDSEKNGRFCSNFYRFFQGQNDRSKIIVSKELEGFADSFKTKLQQNLFLGMNSQEQESIQRAQFRQTRLMAINNLRFMKELPVSPQPKNLSEETERIAKDFFSLSFKVLSENKEIFPLAGYNKCIGFTLVPTTNLVIIAVSQDKNPLYDKDIRKEMTDFLMQLNQKSPIWKYELACIPTKSQFIMLRTFSMRTPHRAPQEWIKPHTRCVEVALAVALCKAGRFKQFNAEEIDIRVYGGSLWSSEDGTEAIQHFKTGG